MDWNQIAPALGPVSGTFRRMGIAEEEIARAKLSRALGQAAFGVLCPPPLLRNKDDEVYRAHARELIARVRNGVSTEPATRAEVLAALSELTLVAPPDQQHAALMEGLFGEVMGKSLDGSAIHEPFPEASNELLAQMQHQFRTDGRK